MHNSAIIAEKRRQENKFDPKKFETAKKWLGKWIDKKFCPINVVKKVASSNDVEGKVNALKSAFSEMAQKCIWSLHTPVDNYSVHSLLSNDKMAGLFVKHPEDITRNIVYSQIHITLNNNKKLMKTYTNHYYTIIRVQEKTSMPMELILKALEDSRVARLLKKFPDKFVEFSREVGRLLGVQSEFVKRCLEMLGEKKDAFIKCKMEQIGKFAEGIVSNIDRSPIGEYAQKRKGKATV